ncbi:PHP domain-containing protein [Thermoflavimicrobium daqui]|jgi:predicted metal-dependent phosphoesterase TrpH|uniref:Phosphatase n=1 Tax=Thermoflavimicrobium daqui TaxID=2137476 RepID=A0A364K6J3_9BACL|nr:PHP domain-containing protein [Thermoflavimicrobium daqui]RAL25931.1 phosphatase [Thermoflavimicrobium daqui]
MGKADLHAHTTASDGLFTPSQLVQHAQSLGIQAVAITDHDTVSGIAEGLEAGKKLGIQVIPGVELSTLWNGKEIHMLGYYIQFDNENFRTLLMKQRNTRKLRNEMMIRKLNELGISISLEEVNQKKKSSSKELNVGRPHIAEVLIEKGIVGSMNEAFDKYLGKDGLAYITPERISPFEAIDLVKQNGGVTVLAHPGLYQQDDLIPQLVQHGLIGIEVNHPDHTAEDRKRYQEIATKYQLITTAGSDFHGERQGSMYHAELGTCTVDISQVAALQKKSGSNK